MLCNLARLREGLLRDGLAAVVATTFENVLYLSDFGNPLPYQTGTAAAAIVPADPQRPAILVVGMPYLAHLVVEPTWMPQVEVFGSIGIEVNREVELGYPEAEVLAAVEAAESRRHPSLAHAVSAALSSLGLLGATVAFARPACAAGVPDWPGTAVDAGAVLSFAQAIKTPAEVDRLRRASIINEQAFAAANRRLVDGGDWLEVTRTWYGEWATQGGTGAFWGGGSGAHASQFYPLQTSYALRTGDLIRYEGGGTYEGYWADSGRTAAIGTPTDRARTYVRALKTGAEVAQELIRPGATGDEICTQVLAAIRGSGIPNFPAANVWGHGIGLHLNEAPRLRAGVPGVLEPGMVICFETPYFELGWGGLQVEDTYLITETGHEILTFADRDLLVV
jgi:Xaa-Pro dipeptidase